MVDTHMICGDNFTLNAVKMEEICIYIFFLLNVGFGHRMCLAISTNIFLVFSLRFFSVHDQVLSGIGIFLLEMLA